VRESQKPICVPPFVYACLWTLFCEIPLGWGGVWEEEVSYSRVCVAFCSRMCCSRMCCSRMCCSRMFCHTFVPPFFSHMCAPLFTHACPPLFTHVCGTHVRGTHMYPSELTHVCLSPSDYQDRYQDTVPFLAVGAGVGSVLKQRFVSHPTLPIHTSFTMDANRFDVMYSAWLRWLTMVLVGGLSCIAICRAIKVGVAPSLTTKALVVASELPAVLYLLWTSIRGQTIYTGANPTLLLACGDGLVFLGLASKILVARFWRSYHAHLKLGAEHKFVDPGKQANHRNIPRQRTLPCAHDQHSPQTKPLLFVHTYVRRICVAPLVHSCVWAHKQLSPRSQRATFRSRRHPLCSRRRSLCSHICVALSNSIQCKSRPPFRSASPASRLLCSVRPAAFGST